MDNLDPKTPVQADESDLRAQYDQLRLLIALLLILVTLISVTLNMYLWRQCQYSRRDLTAIRPQVAQMVAEYQRSSSPMINDFVKKLADYGRTHPDFAPVLAKYGIRTAGPANTPPAALGSPPAAAPKK